MLIAHGAILFDVVYDLVARENVHLCLQKCSGRVRGSNFPPVLTVYRVAPLCPLQAMKPHIRMLQSVQHRWWLMIDLVMSHNDQFDLQNGSPFYSRQNRTSPRPLSAPKRQLCLLNNCARKHVQASDFHRPERLRLIFHAAVDLFNIGTAETNRGRHVTLHW